MVKNIQAMAGHYLNLLVCFLVLLNAQAQTHNVSITIVQSAVEKGAVCLDASPPAYYHDKGYGSGANNWVIFLQGGGWCRDEHECASRIQYQGVVTSSTKMDTQIRFAGILGQNKTVNPDLYNWNRVFVAYCDGSSFSGDVEEVNPETNIHRRGARVFNAIMDDLMAKGLNQAHNVILTGQSAGGLATMLHCDQFRAQLPHANKVKCLADAGFFIHGEDIPGASETTTEQPYSNIIAYHGMDKMLPKSCTSKMDKNSCLYPENFVGDIKTPLFLVNSAFDVFQIPLKVYNPNASWISCLQNITSCEPTDIQAMQYFRTSFIKALPKSNPSIGLYVVSCYTHDHDIYDGRWNNPKAPIIKNKTIAKAFMDWYFDGRRFQEIDTDDTPRTNCSIYL